MTRIRELATQAWRRIESSTDPVATIQAAIVEALTERDSGMAALDCLPPGDRAVALALWGAREARLATIATAVGIPRRTCMHRVLRLSRRGVVQRVRHGWWRLTVNQRPLTTQQRDERQPYVAVLELAKRHGEVDAGLVASRLGVRISTAYTRLYYLCKSGKLSRVRQGTYALTTPTHPSGVLWKHVPQICAVRTRDSRLCDHPEANA